jgi:hypothetical protein
VGNVRYSLIVAGLPLPDIGLQEFLTNLRALDSGSGESPVVILAPEADVPALSRALSSKLLRVIPDTSLGIEIQRAISEVLGVAARTTSRLLVEVEVGIGGGSAQRRLVQTHNLSETGMLVRATEAPPVGSRVQLSFHLPHDSQTIRCGAEVVRESDPEVEGLGGFAVRYLDLRDEDRERLRAFVTVDLETASEARAAGDAALAS